MDIAQLDIILRTDQAVREARQFERALDRIDRSGDRAPVRPT